jgi:quercetin dioxygenase-like cupin family protein
MTTRSFHLFRKRFRLYAILERRKFLQYRMSFEAEVPMKKSEANRPRAGHRQSLTRLPQLADEVIRRNISEELEKLKEAPSWKREAGRSSETLVKYAEFRIVLVRMKPGSYMSHHRAEGPISVHALLGKVRIHLPEDRTEDLVPGDLLTLDRGLEHDVEALEESAFLLTIAWPETIAGDHG